MTDNTGTAINRKTMPLWIVWLLVAGIVMLDQYTKLLCIQYLQQGTPLNIFPGLDFLLAYNQGAAFSFLDGAGGWQRWFLGGISILMSTVLIIWLWRLPRHQKLLMTALALILGGALGNLYDRVMTGYVVDFISVYAGHWRFAIFNVADAAVSCGAVLMAFEILLSGVRRE